MVLPEGARVAIVGAGPAGCLLAAALLDAARARRTPLQVMLFHGGANVRRPMLLDPAAVEQLAAAGMPLPSEGVIPLHGVRGAFGAARAEAAAPLFAARRGTGGPDDFVEYLRAVAMQKGAQLFRRPVEAICGGGAGGFTVRAAGASMRAEAVVLACGAGAPLAARLPGHQPPPVWRACAADLEVAPEDEALGPWATTVHGSDGLPDLRVVSAAGDEQVIAVGSDAGPSALARALLAAVANGSLPPLRLRNPRRVFLPAGVARPGLPAVGDALGGAPDGWRLAVTARQAQLLAAAFLDGGPAAMLDAARAEAVRQEGRIRRAMRRHRRWQRRSAEVVEHAIAREADRPRARRPVERLLASSGAPADAVAAPPLLSLRAFVALALAWLLLVLASLRAPRAPELRPRSGRVFVVDDDEDLSGHLCELLERRGVACVAFRDGMSAVAAAVRERPAAVVLDVALPWLDGPTVCRTLRRREPIPVFLTTALPLSLARREGEAAGATAVLSKPLDAQELVARLQAWVPMRRIRPPPQSAAPARADAAPPG